MIMRLCDRFKCLPSQALREPAWVFGLLELDDMIRPRQRPALGEGEWDA